MSLFQNKNKLDETLDEIANIVYAKIVEKDSKLTSDEKDKMYLLNEQKLKMFIGFLDKDESYYNWYESEVGAIKANLKYRNFRAMALSATITHFAFLDEEKNPSIRKQHGFPFELTKSVLQPLLEVYVRLLQKNGLGPLALPV